MNELIYLLIFFFIVIGIGIKEHKSLDRSLEKIPDRILVNGIRGKSTVTRLVMGILKEDKRKVVGKTTGTSARMFYWDQEEEEPIVRGLQGPNISEQKTMAKKVVDKRADAFVSECMAVHPEYQKVFQAKLAKANITIITNVLEDHMDVMGPTLRDMAKAFSETIPYNGYVVIPEMPYERIFRRKAAERNSEVIVADESLIDEEYLKKFPFMIFPQNAALALAVADIMEIDRDVALAGMLKAPVDPGAMKVHRFGSPQRPKYFFNGFAANDVTSTLNIWKRIQELGYPSDNVTIIMNCRDDRVERTIEFANQVFPYIKMDQLVLFGKNVQPILEKYEEGTIPAERIVNLEKEPTNKVIEYLNGLPDQSVIYAVGNINQGGAELVEAVQEQEIYPEHLEDYEMIESAGKYKKESRYKKKYSARSLQTTNNR
ncbi:poly-gamma-glutamate synthase PgsB [Halobacillus campisalis]|uniref:Poly-gamma-glutamate synthase PgsB n=1 Tax=Halobacillus campisalis TaxID=435909 RepID=A0ABW2JZC7_9BACI|nr:poly-gamma-glutamate synthase PgsB [Halobacillus campisalis]